MTDSPFVVISILNWKGWQDALECLESLLGQVHRKRVRYG